MRSPGIRAVQTTGRALPPLAPSAVHRPVMALHCKEAAAGSQIDIVHYSIRYSNLDCRFLLDLKLGAGDR